MYPPLQNPTQKPQLLAWWLYIVAAMVVGIVIIGGITRLTESGLSITEWQLAAGILPPLTETAWLVEFEKYQQIPEYQQINLGMTLDAFKEIYFWEWFHRLWGRLIGLALALPLVFFAWRRWIPTGFGVPLAGLVILVGVQGGIGWWMVTSGLSERTDVSHFRLSLHLLVALALLATLIWTACAMQAMQMETQGRTSTNPTVTILPFAVATLLALQLLLGAWMAGLNAGQIATGWPLMNGRFFPAGVDWSHGILYALSHDVFLIHFLHRWLAWLVAMLLGWVAWRLYQQRARRTAMLLLAVIIGQIGSGIITVLSGTALVQAAFHQAMGAIVVGVTTLALHRLRQPKIQQTPQNNRLDFPN